MGLVLAYRVKSYRLITLKLIACRTCERSVRRNGKRIGAGRVSGNGAENGLNRALKDRSESDCLSDTNNFLGLRELR